MIAISFDKQKDALCYNTWGHPILFSSYETKGWKDTEWIQIPESGFAFRIMSNFGFGNKAYLKCFVKYKEKMLVNSDSWCETKNQLTYWEEQPTPHHWMDLLRHIVDSYKKRDAWNYNNILDAADKLNRYLSFPELLEVNAHKWSKSHFNYSIELKNIHLIEKCDELITKIQELKLENYDNISNSISEICRKVIALIFKTYNSIISESSNTVEIREILLEKTINCFNTVYMFLQNTNQHHLLFSNKNIINEK